LTLVEPLLEGPDLAHIDLGHQATDGGLVSLAGRLVRFTSHLVVRGAVALKSLQALALHQAPDRCTDTTSRYLAFVHGPGHRQLCLLHLALVHQLLSFVEGTEELFLIRLAHG